MKKFCTSFFVLIIFASVGLFFGWAHLGVPPDAYGIIRSKTHGIDSRLVKPGEFMWVWYKLIPTNAQTTIFRLNPVRHEFSARNTLPSGNTYAAFAGITGNFSWAISASFSFSLQPESLVSLVTVNNISSQEELVSYGNDLAKQIEAYILRCMNYDDTFAEYIEELLKNGESPELIQKIQQEFPAIIYFSIQIKSATLPDFALYRQAKELYEVYVAIQKEQIPVDLQNKTKDRIEAYHRFYELEQYGLLLTRYPVLLDYLKINED